MTGRHIDTTREVDRKNHGLLASPDLTDPVKHRAFGRTVADRHNYPEWDDPWSGNPDTDRAWAHKWQD